MTFEKSLDQVIAMLQRRRRVTYRALKRRFDLEDAALEERQAEFMQGWRLAVAFSTTDVRTPPAHGYVP